MTLLGQLVTAADLEPAGWVCQGCQAPFRVGDVATPTDFYPFLGEGVWLCGSCMEGQQ